MAAAVGHFIYRRMAKNAAVFLFLPAIIGYLLLATLAGVVATLAVVPAVIIVRRFYWALPFSSLAIKSENPRTYFFAKWFFECYLTCNTVARLLTWPLRPLPDFYIAGFPKCGTTTLANYLKRHPALGSVVGPPLHDTLTKESHFFSGILGRKTTHMRWLYRCFFPTVLSSWWAEVVRGVKKYKCFDACPANACMPHMAERMQRMTPDAKLIFLIRDPVSAMFSGEIMMRNWGVDLPWSLVDEIQPSDDRFKERQDEIDLWQKLQNLGATEPLPEEMPKLMCTRIGMYLRFGKSGDRIMPFLKRFPRQNIMFVDFRDLISDTERVLKEVFEFIEVEPERYTHRPLPPGMKSEYKGRRVHPSVRQTLEQEFFKVLPALAV